MSGGSFNYLCHADADNVAEKVSDISDMAERLAGLGYAEDAAKETFALLLTIRQQQALLDAYIDRLSGVWRAVEWWDSCDTSEDGVKTALGDYRAGRQQASAEVDE